MTARPYWVEFPGSGADKGDPYCRNHNAVSLERALAGPVQPGPWMGLAQYSDLMPQHQEIGALGCQ